MDLSATEISGKDLEEALEEVAVTVNKNTVPQEKRSPFVTSGIRLGTPALTSRGMDEKAMDSIAHWIRQTCDNISNKSELAKIKIEVMELAKKYPLYSDWTN
jgi:glycine hydroxymethyltransferase